MPSTPARLRPSLLGAALAAVILAGPLVAAGPAAAAEIVSTVDGIAYRVDPDRPELGATAISGPGVAGIATLPESVEIEGQDYVVTAIGPAAFAGRGLNRLDLPSGLVSIGDFALADNPLIAAVIPASVRSIGVGAFSGGDRLYEVDLLGPVPDLTPAGPGESFVSSMTALNVPWAQTVEAGVAGGYTTPAWRGYDTVAMVTVSYDAGDHGTAPDTQTFEQGRPFFSESPTPDGDWLFLGWFTDAALTTPFAEGSAVQRDLTLHAAWSAPIRTSSGMTFAANLARPQDGATVIAYDPAVGGTDPIIPALLTIGSLHFEVREIAESVFNGAGLTSVRIPDSVTTIGPYAFLGNTDLEEVVLPASLRELGYNVFAGDALRSVVIPPGVTVVQTWSFLENRLESAVIPEGVTTIQSGAFLGNDLTEVTIPASVTQLNPTAFDDNPHLSRVVLLGPPPVVTEAGSWQETFDTASGELVLDVPWRYTAAAGDADGYTTPTWRGYAVRAIATVSFDVAGADAPIDARSIPVGDDLAELPEPTRAGYVFAGWRVDGAPVTAPLAITGDLVLTAAWRAVATPPAAPEILTPTGSEPASGLVVAAALALGGLVLATRRRLRRG